MSQSPRHIAIIMDGNGRWATQRGLPRTAGHQRGVESVKRVVEAAVELGVEYLTLFGFSTENWSRPVDEVRELMRLLRMYLRAETAELHRNNIRLKVIGRREELEPDIVKMIEQAENLTANNTAITVMIALNYGGRQDILCAATQMARAMAEQGIEPTYESAEEYLPQFLSTAGAPDPDILIRTSGERRISNFLLWQCAYSELFYCDTLWPDFSKVDLEAAIADFKSRDRRFGGVKSGKQ
ncbi:isoprenyl transferase [Micavibrio aeruginosavorus]|uniref:Isoprenyl transferase n=1 Tax=Micavibrio aeruginosavorus EPB TaxID=349215 RepID=M4VHX2_9BACT|nr:isoprenyl transferase [Micavibrio aeruginosavorus]AGH98080.1 Undecaprenyl pyrophosphate synthetase [Micavibrio aeruginosavorus EPB]